MAKCAPLPLRSWSSHELEASQGLAGIFERRCLGEGDIELALELIARLYTDPKPAPIIRALSCPPFCFDLPAVGLCIAAKSPEPASQVSEFIESIDGLGVVEVRRVSNVYEEALRFSLWVRRCGKYSLFIKRPSGVYVSQRFELDGAGPCFVLFTKREEE